jgi:hypothetical protein
MKAFYSTFREIELQDVVSSVIFSYKFTDKELSDATKVALITLGQAKEAYMVEVISKSHCYQQRLIPCRFSTYLLPWQGGRVQLEQSDMCQALQMAKMTKGGFSQAAM